MSNWDKKWDDRFIAMAFMVASWSKDPDRKVGAVIVSSDRRSVSYGYNGFPRGIDDSEERLWNNDVKIDLTVHAELNAILNAHFELKGSVLYVTQPPCHECSKAIVQKGISTVFAPHKRDMSKWLTSWRLGETIMQEAGIVRFFIRHSEGE